MRRSHFFRHALEGGWKAAGLEVHGVQSVRKLPRLRGRVTDRHRQLADCFGLWCLPGGQIPRGKICLKGDSDQVLAQSIVQVLADSSLLLGAGVQDLPFENSPPTEVMNNTCKQPPLPQAHFADRETHREGAAAVLPQAAHFAPNPDDLCDAAAKVIADGIRHARPGMAQA